MREIRKIQIALPSLGDDEWLAVREPLQSGWLTQGPKVAEFEAAFRERLHVRHALATTSCTTALHLALAALGVGPGDEVIVPSFTWVATANAVVYCGADPVLCDVDPRTYNIDVESCAAKVTPRTRAVIAVHLFGLCAEMRQLSTSLPASVAIVEDAACAAGASFDGKPAGTIGEVGCFSFHPRKAITTGEGGMLTTNRDDIATRAAVLRSHGASASKDTPDEPNAYLPPDFDEVGFNYRMTDVQAAIGLVQLRKLDQFIEERERKARFYRDALADIEWLRQPAWPNSGKHAWQAYVTYVDPKIAPLSRNALMARLHDRGISTRPGTHAVHMLGYYRNRFSLKPDDMPGACDCDRNTLAIPLHNRMSDDDYAYVVDCLREIARGA